MTQVVEPQNLFVGSLAYSTTDDTLRAHFEKIGPIESARVITDRDDGRSKGFGFVQFQNNDDNQKAIDELNGSELDGRAITISLARPREERPRRRDFGGDRPSSSNGSRNGSFRQRTW